MFICINIENNKENNIFIFIAKISISKKYISIERPCRTKVVHMNVSQCYNKVKLHILAVNIVHVNQNQSRLLIVNYRYNNNNIPNFDKIMKKKRYLRKSGV